ncbi:MAG: GNAT family N-acetyltransferase [Dermatophilaceae bacterium]
MTAQHPLHAAPATTTPLTSAVPMTPTPRRERDACAVLADAFAADPWAAYVLGAPASNRATALAAVMRAPVHIARRRGGLALLDDAAGKVGAAATWIPAGGTHVGFADAVRARALLVPVVAGIRTMTRLTQDEAELTEVVAGHGRPGDAYAWVLGVRRDLHGRGLGRAVVDLACDQARQRGFRRMTLNTDTPTNVAIYQRLGFELCGTARRRSGLLAHVMARPLG